MEISVDVTVPIMESVAPEPEIENDPTPGSNSKAAF
jgi:hypothetical protein